jgi:hypothetical protein
MMIAKLMDSKGFLVTSDPGVPWKVWGPPDRSPAAERGGTARALASKTDNSVYSTVLDVVVMEQVG